MKDWKIAARLTGLSLGLAFAYQAGAVLMLVTGLVQATVTLSRAVDAAVTTFARRLYK